MQLEPSVPNETRAAVMRRCRGRCERCGLALRLDIHHLHYNNVGHETPRDVMALCRECHKDVHGH
jgi:5-methylcytosine-specific restriction endonuclease McrA